MKHPISFSATHFHLAICLVILILFIGYCAGVSFIDIPMNFAIRNHAPSKLYWFGTDNMGRNFWLRCFQASFTSIIIGVCSSLLTGVIALFFSAISIIHPKLAQLVKLITDALLSIPNIILLILISFTIGNNALGVILAIGFTFWPKLSVLLRNEMIKVNNSDYIILAKRLGNSTRYRWFHHLFPILFTQWLVGSFLIFPSAILHCAALSFLGFGLSQDSASLGLLISDSLHYLNMGEWWIALFPGLLLLLIVLFFDHVLTLLKKIIVGDLC